MKRHRLLFAVCALTLISQCTRPESGGEPEIEPPTIEIDGRQLWITLPETAAGSATLSFTASDPWQLSTSDTRAVPSWFTVSPESGGAGTQTVTISLAEANPSLDDRSGYIKISSGETERLVTVTQKRKGALLVTDSRYEVAMEGGVIDVEVKANVAFNATVQNSDWIRRRQNTRAMQTSSLQFDIDPSEERIVREGHITISAGELSETISVFQAGGDIFVLSQKAFDVPDTGETIRIDVRSNIEYSVTMPGVDWIEESSSHEPSVVTRRFDILPNNTYDAREAKIIFTSSLGAEEVTVRQMQKDALIVADNEYTVEAEGGSLDFDVQHNIDFNVTIGDSAREWISRNTTRAGTRALETSPLSFTVASNPQYYRRVGTITITSANISQTITVIQNGVGVDPATFDVIEQLPDTAFRNYCRSMMNNPPYDHWDTDDNGKLSIEEAAAIQAMYMSSHGISSLEGIQFFSGLTHLYCDNNYLEALDLSANHLLTTLDCSYNILTQLDLSINSQLTQLFCTANLLEGIDISKNTAISAFRCILNPGNNSTFLIKAWFDNDHIPANFDSATWYHSNGNVSTFYYNTDTPPLLPNANYTSTDYSADGRVTVLQTATEGEGIDYVIMGDGFSDRWVASGEYERIMREAMDLLFTEEPYKSFRHLFNVYAVTAVSQREVFDSSLQTAFSVYFGDGTLTMGDNDKVVSYARKAVDRNRIDDTTITVVLNTYVWAGTCHYISIETGDYGRGTAVGYCPIIYNNPYNFGQVLNHEIGGHAFAKLADEYWSVGAGQISIEEIRSKREFEPYGWDKNVDYTADQSVVKWSGFLSDTRYAGQGLGIFEGAEYYEYGAYRSTDNSIMRHNIDGFNAPSRQAIYYRIHKLAYGSRWQYNHETFVTWDLSHRSRAPYAPRTARKDMTHGKEPAHFAPPVYNFTLTK